MCLDLNSQDSLAERSKAVAQGAIPQGRGFEPHSCHIRAGHLDLTSLIPTRSLSAQRAVCRCRLPPLLDINFSCTLTRKRSVGTDLTGLLNVRWCMTPWTVLGLFLFRRPLATGFIGTS